MFQIAQNVLHAFNLESPTVICPYFSRCCSTKEDCVLYFFFRTWIKSRSLVVFHFVVPVLKLHGNNTLPLHIISRAPRMRGTFYTTRDVVNDIITRSNAVLHNDEI